MKIAINTSTGLHVDFQLKSEYEYKIHWDQFSLAFGTWHSGWMLLLPAMLMGVPLYFLKKHHVQLRCPGARRR